MAPVRRYLRISKYSVLECRIYLDNPSLAQSWLLSPRYDVLPRIVESIRPLVLPKLREERERSRKKSSKKKSIKDVIIGDDFEVSMFLTETSTRHSLLTKQKHFREKGPFMMQSNSTKLIDETNNNPVDVDGNTRPVVLREEDSDDGNDGNVRLSEIPLASSSQRQKRPRIATDVGISEPDTHQGAQELDAIQVDSDEDEPASKRARGPGTLEEDESDGEDDKKKLAMDVSYEGFAIYGRVLCLVVRKRENRTARARPDGSVGSSHVNGQANMENWITSTQIPVGDDAA